uniref:Uncharacterized protein n=1 Tax=Arundo donax TaxID=35708 RepID=A0A0A8YCI4_ARUDO
MLDCKVHHGLALALPTSPCWHEKS